MASKPNIRETGPADIAHVLALYPEAFPQEELRPLVSSLLELETQVISLAAFEKELPIGHILFTHCGLVDREPDAALLGPLCVKTSHQRQGTGKSLVLAGLDRLKRSGMNQVFVLGDPAYYQQFGFVPEENVSAPYPLPDEYEGAWQSLLLVETDPIPAGKLWVREPWLDPALW